MRRYRPKGLPVCPFDDIWAPLARVREGLPVGAEEGLSWLHKFIAAWK